LLLGAQSTAAQSQAWETIRRKARGQTVFWNAWAGDERTNAFIQWAAERVAEQSGIAVRHVRLRDTAEAVARVVAEKTAGRVEGGSVDLIWINGPNFLSMKEQKLLHGPFTQLLPHFAFVDVHGKQATVIDFTVPVEGFAAPWRMAQVVFIFDSARVKTPPRRIADFVAWAKVNPGRLTHPHPRNFLGATFLKQALYALAPDTDVLQRAATEEGFVTASAPLWEWYAALRPHLWRGGKQFPESGPAQRSLMNDGEIDLMISFNPSEAATAIANKLLPDTVRAYALDGGTIGNASFIAIPFNAAHKEGAMVLADFLVSAEAQAQAQDASVLGAFTVLDLAKLPAEERRRFDNLPRSAATLSSEDLGKPLLEPHPSWMTRITAEWERRHGG
jgi:putative thiamine transport system substrate-binding protein